MAIIVNFAFIDIFLSILKVQLPTVGDHLNIINVVKLSC
jgi:hypothetical protein